MTGGRAGWMTVDSTELFDSSVGSWVIAGAKMPIRLVSLRAINIDDRVLLFGRFLQSFYTYTSSYLKVTIMEATEPTSLSITSLETPLLSSVKPRPGKTAPYAVTAVTQAVTAAIMLLCFKD